MGRELNLGTTALSMQEPGINSDADLMATGILDTGSPGGTTVIVNGAGSSLRTGLGQSSWGFGLRADSVTFRNGASATTGSVSVPANADAGATLLVESGATMTVGDLRIATASGSNSTTGTITVTGAGSRLTQSGASGLFVGRPSQGSATINVNDGGTFDTGTDIVQVFATGHINVGGGNFHFQRAARN